MEGVTDVMFRQVIARAGRPDLFFTEFTNVSSYASKKGRQNALERLEIGESDPPIIAQIWGKDPAHFAECAGALERLRFSGVDLNFGCPDKNVNKTGGGAAMIKTPSLAIDCFRNAVASTNLPVSIKTRLGWAAPEEYAHWLPLLLGEHPAALTVHLRTKKEMSKAPAHYELIPDIVRLRDEISPSTKLIINGDIRDRAHALSLHAEFPTVDGFMIGRGVFQNPYCFVGHHPTRSELLDLLRYHLRLFEIQSKKYRTAHENDRKITRLIDGELVTTTPTLSFEPMKHFFKIYVNHFPGASDLRARLMETHSVAEAREILETSSAFESLQDAEYSDPPISGASGEQHAPSLGDTSGRPTHHA